MRKLTVLDIKRLSPKQFKMAKKTPLVIVSDNVRSLNNIGSFFRTADAFRLEGVWLCGISGTPPSAEIHKTALGAEESVWWHYFEDTMKAVEALKDEGYEIWALEQTEGSVMINDLKIDPNKKYAIVLGNEVNGVGQDVVDACQGAIEIPQFGTKHSLNVSVAAGIIVYKFAETYLCCKQNK